MGKEKVGKVCCYGGTITPSTLKKEKEIYALKWKHDEEFISLKGAFQQMEAQVNELIALMKVLIQPNNHRIYLEMMMAQFGAITSDANSTRNVVG